MQDLSVLNLVIVKKGEQELPGLTDEEKPRQRGPKRASKASRPPPRPLAPSRPAPARPRTRRSTLSLQDSTVGSLELPVWQAGLCT